MIADRPEVLHMEGKEMILDYSERLRVIQDSKAKNDIICQCALDSFVAATQEINSILMILKNEGVTPNDFVKYVENRSGRVTPRLLQRLASVQGNNLLSMSEKLDKDLEKQPKLSADERKELRAREKNIGVDYFMNNDPIITQKLSGRLDELLEADSI